MATTTSKSVAIDVVEVSQEEATLRLLGDTPLIFERMSEKARRELLMPHGPKNKTERATTLKHKPRDEFSSSVYRVRGGPTLLGFPVEGIKDAMRTAALDLTGVSKTEIGRLTYVVGHMAPIWGVPELLMSVVRSADMKRTPDIRTRAIVPRWATEVTVRFVRPNLTAQAISRLLVAAGMTCGIGGFRQEKGAGNYGLWRLATKADAEAFARIVAEGGREAQEAAMAAPSCYDEESADLLEWYEEELGVRRLKGAAA